MNNDNNNNNNNNTESRETKVQDNEEERPRKRSRLSLSSNSKNSKKSAASANLDSNTSTNSVTAATKKKNNNNSRKKEESPIILALLRLDPILQFLTKASGKTKIPLQTLKAALPGCNDTSVAQWRELAHRGVIEITHSDKGDGSTADASGGLMNDRSTSSSNEEIFIGFPPPPTISDNGDDDTTIQNQKLKKLTETGTLHGSTKTAAKRRLRALKRSLKINPEPMLVVESNGIDKNSESAEEVEQGTNDSRDMQSSIIINNGSSGRSSPVAEEDCNAVPNDGKDWDTSLVLTKENLNNFDVTEVQEDEQQARRALETFLKPGKKDTDRTKLFFDKQAAYAASQTGRQEIQGKLAADVQSKIPLPLTYALGLDLSGSVPNQNSSVGSRRLYSHQAEAINSALRRIHTLVCTGTGSGKSLCFLVPVLATAMMSSSQNTSDDNKEDSGTSLILFPTKALAQDQMTKLQNDLLEKHSDLKQYIRVGVIDGDTPHPQRAEAAKHCNIILTNPDTLHAAILPAWKGIYKKMLGRLQYVVIDEAHMYEGVFGAHVAMVLSRLSRLCSVASRTLGKNAAPRASSLPPPTFLGCSATMTHPEHHFRMLCPIQKDSTVTVIDQDGSPRRPKHFFAWNPPIMDLNGYSTGEVVIKRVDTKKKSKGVQSAQDDAPKIGKDAESNQGTRRINGKELYRRHAADETALLLARAIANNVRCIAFCKTRCLVEWVFERTVAKLRSDPTTEHLTSRVESYRGGYTPAVRRIIEKKLFQGELTGVVGTSALELGVDVGGIDLTLHCGYPSSISSLLQQAGRAGRGALRLSVPSLSVMVCFNSPSEQHLWNYPRSLLDRGRSIPPSLPVNEGLLQGHMLCAGQEFPLTGTKPVTALLESPIDSEGQESKSQLLNDCSLLGSTQMYNDALETLLCSKSLVKEIVALPSTNNGKMVVYRTHGAIQKPSLRVSLRSIEPINYSIVDVTHPLQGGLMDTVHDERAVLDTIPYSRVFYHSFPGAVIMHRGQKFKVHAMAKPPAFAHYNAYRSSNLACFAKPTNARYMTRPLSTLKITIVKQIERVDIRPPSKNNSMSSDNQTNNKDTLSGKPKEQIDLKKMDVDQKYPTVHVPNPNEKENWNLSCGSFAGNGVVTVKRSVHGYKKLSPVTREEISRKEISLPPMEYDTYALWIDAEATTLGCVVSDYNDGVHALSHALLAVAPLFVPCSSSDLDCDHSYIDCTRVMLFDARAGGAGTTAALWKHLFVPNGLLDAAIDLLENCPSCHMRTDTGYQGGCPACIQCGQCIKFNMNLSREAGLIIAKRMLQRLRRCDLGKGDQPNAATSIVTPGSPTSQKVNSKEDEETTPRRKARARALKNATDLRSARERQIVVGRPSWPLDQDGEGGRQEKA